MQKAQGLEEVGKAEVEPGQSTGNEVLVSQKAVDLLEIWVELCHAVFDCLFEGLVSVGTIDESDVVGVEVLVDTVSSGQSYMLFGIPSQKFGFSSLVAQVDANSITFSNNLLSIDQIRQGQGWILILQFRLNIVKPFFSALLPSVLVLVVRNGEVLQELSDSFSQASDVPIAKSHC